MLWLGWLQESVVALAADVLMLPPPHSIFPLGPPRARMG